MKKVFSFSLLVAISVFISNVKLPVWCLECRDKVSEVDGDTWRYALEGEFPWMVSLQHAEDSVVTHFCGGSLASPNLVLTACHCLVIHSVFSGNEKPFLTDASSKVVVAGTLNNNRSDPNHSRIVVGISKFIIHPKCQHFNHQDPEDRGGWDYDFGLVVLKKNLTFDGKRLAAFRLFAWSEFALKKDLERQMGRHIECVATGWGKRRLRSPNGTLIEDTGHDPRSFWPQMTILQVKLDDFASCYNIMCGFDKAYCEVDHWWRSQLCATAEGQMEVCYGDSGGPLMCGSEKYLYGLVGWGPSCGKYKVPSVYPTIYDGLDFIKRYVGQDSLRLRTIGNGAMKDEASDNKALVHVSLQYADAGTHYCGGVLLTLDKVLTACHCVAFYKDDYDEELFPLHDKVMVAGSVSNVINPKDPYQQIRHPVKTFCHPKCRSRRRGGFDWDFSIHNVNADFEQSPTVKPCTFVSLTAGVTWKYLVDQVKRNAWCMAVGWGYSNIKNGSYVDPSTLLLKIGVSLLSFSKCHHFLKQFDTFYDKLNLKSRYQVCAMGSNNSDVCKGDSGGGLVCGSHVYGIVSWGPACGEVEVPSMYTAIDGVWDFMLQTVFNGNSKPHSCQNLVSASFIFAIQKFLNM